MGNKTSAKILLVDDCDITRTLLRSILRNADYEVIGEARDANRGLDMAERLRPDIICLDIEMPGTSGIDALPRFHEVLPEGQVLMVTGHNERDMVEAAIEGGASAYIVKPFNAAKVLDTIEQTLTKSRAKGP